MNNQYAGNQYAGWQFRSLKIESTHQLAQCQYNDCQQRTNMRINDGTWLCEEHIQAVKLEIAERRLDGIRI